MNDDLRAAGAVPKPVLYCVQCYELHLREFCVGVEVKRIRNEVEVSPDFGDGAKRGLTVSLIGFEAYSVMKCRRSSPADYSGAVVSQDCGDVTEWSHKPSAGSNVVVSYAGMFVERQQR